MMGILAEWNEVLVSDEDEIAIEDLNNALMRIAKRSISKVKEVKDGQK